MVPFREVRLRKLWAVEVRQLYLSLWRRFFIGIRDDQLPIRLCRCHRRVYSLHFKDILNNGDLGDAVGKQSSPIRGLHVLIERSV